MFPVFVVVTLISISVFYYRRFIYIIVKTAPRDLQFLYRCIKLLYHLSRLSAANETVISLFKKQVASQPDKIVFYFQDSKWTMKELDVYSDKIARIFQNQGYKKGDVVALMSFNCPEFVGIWLGLGKIGVITSLINTNLKSQSLAHCVNVAQCKCFVFMSDFAKTVNEIKDLLPSHMQYIVFDATADFVGPISNLSELLNTVSSEPLLVTDPVKTVDKLLYIYTSGTTGLPKAAIITHRKVLYIAVSLKDVQGWEETDVIYDPLPLYHSAGGLIGIMPALCYGMTTVMRSKFSASNYFADCVKYKCTVGQYIGEICRYLLAVPPSKYDTSHSLRMVVGNGLRPDVWKLFIERFNIPKVIELYGSTEGNANIVNIDNTVGAVGFIPRLLPPSLFPIALIRYDEVKDEPIRDKNGLCIRCQPGESGMCIGIINTSDAAQDFQGYVDQKETSRKIIYNVFKHGDSAFLSGDVLHLGEYGYLFFKDRTGDTYRWKGENVSTGEVEIMISKLINYKDCAVYGVQVGNLEGRAGMVAVADPENEVNLDALAEGIDENLPYYARPVFLRILPALQKTGTFKIQKTDLKKEGFNVHEVKDKLYFKDPKKGFVSLTESLYNDIINGVIKV